MKSHQNGIAELRADMARLLDFKDRFLQAMERGNGQK